MRSAGYGPDRCSCQNYDNCKEDISHVKKLNLMEFHSCQFALMCYIKSMFTDLRLNLCNLSKQMRRIVHIIFQKEFIYRISSHEPRPLTIAVLYINFFGMEVSSFCHFVHTFRFFSLKVEMKFIRKRIKILSAMGLSTQYLRTDGGRGFNEERTFVYKEVGGYLPICTCAIPLL